MKKRMSVSNNNGSVIAKQSRGFRNKNPMNIRLSKSNWLGKKKVSTDRAFEQFEQMKYGVRAGLYLLTKYVRDYKLRTVREIIHRWAPNGDGGNDESAYVHALLSKNPYPTNAVQVNKAWLYALANGMCLVESNICLSEELFEQAFTTLPYSMKCFWHGLKDEDQEREEVDGL